jgi:cell division protein FtsB
VPDQPAQQADVQIDPKRVVRRLAEQIAQQTVQLAEQDAIIQELAADNVRKDAEIAKLRGQVDGPAEAEQP